VTFTSATLMKRSMRIGGHRTSVALEAQFWVELERIARERAVSLPVLLAQIDKQRHPESTLASAARVFALLNPQPAAPWATRS
jgi:predicted DNA-binding ribbon-helix-helix protein